MSKQTDRFIDYITERMWQVGYPFLSWELSLGHISLVVKDLKGNTVKQVWDRHFIEQETCKDLCEYIIDYIDKSFYDERFYKPLNIIDWR